MKAYKVTTTDMENALRQINVKYDGNIVWKRFEQNGSGVHFTLTVNNSKATGSRKSHSGRRIAAACWHVHGDFFDALFEIAPDSYVRSMGRKIDKTQGNWEDRNIGSQMYPMMHSDACDCGSSEHEIKFGTLNPNGELQNVRMIRQSDIGKCPFVIMMPDHYRNDGSCKCNDPEHREMMKREWEYTDDDFKRAGVLQG